MKRQSKFKFFIYVQILFSWEKDLMKNKFNQFSEENILNCIVKKTNLRKHIS